MALHGSIEINGRAIGTWSARRLEPVIHKYAGHDYIVSVEMFIGRTFTATMKHVYDDGALALAAEVLAAADEFGDGHG